MKETTLEDVININNERMDDSDDDLFQNDIDITIATIPKHSNNSDIDLEPDSDA